MESILKSFSIGFLLRNVFAGMFFVVAYRVASQGSAPPSDAESAGFFSLGVPVALFAGVTVYGLHRSLIYPLVEFCMNSAAASKLRTWVPLVSGSTITHLLQQWDRGAEGDKRNYERAKHISAWGDYSQLQYTSALCICLGATVRVVTVEGRYVPSWPLITLAVLLMIAGLVSDWRLHAVQEHIRDVTGRGDR